MKKILYRYGIYNHFYLYKDESETEDIDKEIDTLRQENPTWDIVLQEDSDFINTSFIKKEEKNESA